MKRLSFYIITHVTWIMLSCKSDSSKDIIGRYSSTWHSEFSTTLDTIIVGRLISREAKLYLITNISAIRYIDRSHQRHPRIRTQFWRGVYDINNNTITIDKTGRVLTFSRDGNAMKMETTEYKKIKM